MKAMLLSEPAPIEQSPLALGDLPMPDPGHGQIRIRVRVCGVCHTGTDHFSTMRSGGNRQWRDRTQQPVGDELAQKISLQALPPISPTALGPDEIRDLVTQVVQKTLGKTP